MQVDIRAQVLGEFVNKADRLPVPWSIHGIYRVCDEQPFMHLKVVKPQE